MVTASNTGGDERQQRRSVGHAHRCDPDLRVQRRVRDRRPVEVDHQRRPHGAASPDPQPEAGRPRARTTNGATYAKKLLATTYTSGYFRAYVYLAAGYSSQVNLLRYRTAADGSLGYLFVTTSGKLALRNDVGAVTTTSATGFSSASWHALELRVIVNGSLQHQRGVARRHPNQRPVPDRPELGQHPDRQSPDRRGADRPHLQRHV